MNRETSRFIPVCSLGCCDDYSRRGRLNCKTTSAFCLTSLCMIWVLRQRYVRTLRCGAMKVLRNSLSSDCGYNSILFFRSIILAISAGILARMRHPFWCAFLVMCKDAVCLRRQDFLERKGRSDGHPLKNTTVGVRQTANRRSASEQRVES